MNTRLLLLGATGLVGTQALSLALADVRVGELIAPTRRPLHPHPRLINPVLDFDALDPEAPYWTVNGVLCAWGTTRAKAGSTEAFRHIDLDIPLAIARLARDRGARRFALVSSMGASALSRLLYPRTKGELEEELATLAFPSLTILRPGLLGGNRGEFRFGERVAETVLKGMGGLLPARYRPCPAENVARFLLEAAIDGPPGLHQLEAEHFVQGVSSAR